MYERQFCVPGSQSIVLSCDRLYEKFIRDQYPNLRRVDFLPLSGSQERNVAAMLAGAVSLTDSSTYIQENFCDGKDIVLYSLKEMNQIPGLIHTVLEDDERGEAIVEAGYRKAVSGHTWEHRVKEMLAIINQERKQ